MAEKSAVMPMLETMRPSSSLGTRRRMRFSTLANSDFGHLDARAGGGFDRDDELARIGAREIRQANKGHQRSKLSTKVPRITSTVSRGRASVMV